MYGHGVMLQEDRVSYHHGGFIGLVKKAAEIQVLEWPPQSPDLSPIENIWHYMKIGISARRHRIKNVQQMAEVIREVWEQIPVEVFVKMTDSMPKWLDLLRQSKGGPIKY